MDLKSTKGLTEESYLLISKLLDKNPDTRLGSRPEDIFIIQNSSFFRGIDWIKLRLKLIPLNMNFRINEPRPDHTRMPQNFKDFSMGDENTPHNSVFYQGIESDCSQTSLWVDNFTHDQPTSRTLVK